MAKVTTSELENMIRAKIQEKGLGADITNEKIKEIKDSIKSKITGKQSPAVNSNEEIVVDVPTEVPSSVPGKIPSAVTSATSSDPKAVEVAKKEGELSQKEQEISSREAQVSNRESELQRKKDELTYTPKIPSVLENVGPEKIFIFNQNEISLGAEALSNASFRMVSNPDEKKSMNDLWLESGVRKVEVFVVKFEKLGEITFDPFRGTSSFEEKRFQETQSPESETGGLTPAQAKQSQEPTSAMTDAIAPVKDVTLPMSQDMGLASGDVQSAIDKKIEDILRTHFLNKKQ